MKKSDLKKHIKEEILSILKEGELNIPTPSGTSSDVSSEQKAAAQKASAAGTMVKYIKKGQVKEDKETESTETYMISKAGPKSTPYYVLEAPDGSKQIDMMFSSPEEAKKYATKKNLKLSSKKGYNMNESKEINGIPGTVTIGGGKSGILIPTNQGDYIYYVTDDEYNAFINAGGNAQKLMATIFLKSGKAKPYKPKYNPMASLGGGKGHHIDEDKFDDKITNLEKYTYTLNGKKVTPEIGYFDHSLKAMISTPRSGDEYFDYEFYRIGEPDESGNIELSPEKGKKGMYTEEMEPSGFKSGREFINIKLQKYPKAVAKINQLINMIGEDKFTMEMAKWLFDFFNNASYESPVNEAKIESDFFEREPKSKDIEKGEGIIAKTTRLLKFQKELKTLSKDMQDLAAEYREAEGSDKDEILRTLKVKTAAKKELERKIEQLEKYV